MRSDFAPIIGENGEDSRATDLACTPCILREKYQKNRLQRGQFADTQNVLVVLRPPKDNALESVAVPDPCLFRRDVLRTLHSVLLF